MPAALALAALLGAARLESTRLPTQHGFLISHAHGVSGLRAGSHATALLILLRVHVHARRSCSLLDRGRHRRR